MRKFFLLTVLVMILCVTCTVSSGAEVPSNPFSGFGLCYEYVTSGSVRLRIDGEPDYSGVQQFKPNGVSLGGTVRKDYESNVLPLGTLTVVSSDRFPDGQNYYISPIGLYSYNYGSYAGTFQGYNVGSFYYGIQYLAGSKILWNLYTSPDVTVGSAVIKKISELEPISIDVNDIVPFVRVNHRDDKPDEIGRIDLWFVKSGDWSVPVAVNLPSVTLGVVMNWDSPSHTFTEFSKPYPVRQSHYFEMTEDLLQGVTVSYMKDGKNFTWNFEPVGGHFSSINWGDLALSEQPLTLKTGESKDITIKIPSWYKFSLSSDAVEVGNSSVLEVDDLNFKQGSGTWNGMNWRENKSELSFTLIAGEPGVTALKVYIPNITGEHYDKEAFYREIIVTDESGDMNFEEKNSVLKPLLEHATSVVFSGDIPKYNSASDRGLILHSLSGLKAKSSDVFTVSERTFYDSIGGTRTISLMLPLSGHLGIVNGSTHEIMNVQAYNVSDDEYMFCIDNIIGYGLFSYVYPFSTEGVSFNTLDSNDNGEYSLSPVHIPDDFSEITLWYEFPESPDLNSSPIKLSSLISADKIRSTSEQLEDFVPFVRPIFSEDKNYISAIEWSFVKSSNLSQVNPSEISDISINGISLNGTSGTLNFPSGQPYSNSGGIDFEYVYDGIRYYWMFSYSGSSTTKDVTSDDFSVEIDMNFNGPVIGGVPDYNNVRGGPSVYLVCNGRISGSVFWDNGTYPFRCNVYVSRDYYEEGEDPEDVYTIYPDYTLEGGMDGLFYRLKYNLPLLRGGQKFRCEFPSGFFNSGDYTMPAIPEISENLRPKFKIVADGLNAKSLEWTLNGSGVLSVDVNSSYSSSFHANGLNGSIVLNIPEISINSIVFTHDDGNIVRTWNFQPVDVPDDYHSNLVVSADFSAFPGFLKAGESCDITLSLEDENFDNLLAYVGNSDILSFDIISSDDRTVKIRLTGKSAGITTLGTTFTDRYNYGHSEIYLGRPIEIWVASLDVSTGKYVIPGLTDDAEAFMKSLASMDANVYGWVQYSEESVTPVEPPVIPEPEAPHNMGIDGLSVYPRYAVPQDPSEDAYNEVWSFVDTMNLQYGVNMLTAENSLIIASRDAVAVFNELSADLVSGENPKLIAVVLPEIRIFTDGLYMFRLPTENITLEDTEIFFRTYSEEQWQEVSRVMFVDDEGNITGAVSGEKFINVAAYFMAGTYRPLLLASATSRDVELILENSVIPDPKPEPDPTSPDIPAPSSPDIPATTSPDRTITPESSMPHAPSVNVDTVADNLRRLLSRPNVSVDILPERASGHSRGISDLSTGQLNSIMAQGREPAVVLPEISVDVAAVYVFGVSLDNLAEGTKIFLDMTTREVTGSVYSSEEYTGDYTFLNDDGDEVSTVPANKHVNVAAYLEAGKIYSPVVTMESSEAAQGVSSSSGGCDSGLTLGLMLTGLLILRKKR